METACQGLIRLPAPESRLGSSVARNFFHIIGRRQGVSLEIVALMQHTPEHSVRLFLEHLFITSENSYEMTAAARGAAFQQDIQSSTVI
jgi:hypothetical protein